MPKKRCRSFVGVSMLMIVLACLQVVLISFIIGRNHSLSGNSLFQNTLDGFAETVDDVVDSATIVEKNDRSTGVGKDGDIQHEQSAHRNASGGDEIAHNTQTTAKQHEQIDMRPSSQPHSQPQSQSQKRQPRMIIHIGPSKTATTTIQKESVALQELQILEKDDFLYWGRYQKLTRYKGRSLRDLEVLFHSATFRDYARLNAKSVDPKHIDNSNRLHQLRRLLDFLKAEGKSVFISDEALSYSQMFSMGHGTFASKNYFENLSHVLDGWNVTVVAGYRRLTEWTLSAVKEHHAKISIYGDATVNGKVQKNSMLWPHEGGFGLPVSWDLIDQWMFGPHFKRLHGPGTTALFYKYIDFTLKLWRHGGFATAIIDLHDPSLRADDGRDAQHDNELSTGGIAKPRKSLMQMVYCDIIGDVPNICQHLDQKEAEDHHNVRSVAWFAYNHLLFDASRRGLFNTTGTHSDSIGHHVTRIEATDQFQRIYETQLGKSFADLPLLCPRDEQLERLLQQSIDMERSLFPDRSAEVAARMEHQHNATFRKAAFGNRVYCWARTKIVLRQLETWDGVIDRLRHSNSTTWPLWYMEEKRKAKGRQNVPR